MAWLWSLNGPEASFGRQTATTFQESDWLITELHGLPLVSLSPAGS